MIIYGKQVIFLAQSVPEIAKRIETIYLAKEIKKSDFAILAKLNKPIVRIDTKKAQSLCKGGNHQGYLAQIQEPSLVSLKALKQESYLLVLSNVTDMGNIGALARSAYALGFGGLVISGIENFKLEIAIRTSSGALLLLPVCVYKNVLDVACELKSYDFTLFAGHNSGEAHTELNHKEYKKAALFLGSEDQGLHKRLLDKMQRIFCIKMSHSFDSLNVNAAGAILMDRITQWNR